MMLQHTTFGFLGQELICYSRYGGRNKLLDMANPLKLLRFSEPGLVATRALGSEFRAEVAPS